MTRYISNPDNLKLMMNMLKERSRNIQFEAFHVFKVCFCIIFSVVSPIESYKELRYTALISASLLKRFSDKCNEVLSKYNGAPKHLNLYRNNPFMHN